MTRNARTFFLAAGVLILIIFVALISELLNRGSVTFTEDDTLSGPVIERSDPTKGDDSPAALIVYFGDFTCEACAELAASINTVLMEFPEDVLVVWKDFPNPSFNSESYPAAIAARCADRQDAFWDYHDALMLNQDALGGNAYSEIAAQLGLKQGSFDRCLRKESTIGLVDEGLEQARALELIAAPTLFINGEKYAGSMEEFELRALVRSIVEQQDL